MKTVVIPVCAAEEIVVAAGRSQRTGVVEPGATFGIKLHVGTERLWTLPP